MARPREPRGRLAIAVPDDVDLGELTREARGELRSLPKPLADRVGGHLVTAGRLLDEGDAEGAYQHAQEARRLAPRVGVVREVAGLAAYASGRWSDALSDLRASRRMSGSPQHLPVMADCERGLGRPERALAMAASRDVEGLDQAGKIEMRIVAAGARRDLGQIDAAVVMLQGPDLHLRPVRPWSARLFYAYADALLAAGREEEGRTWMLEAAMADAEDTTGAAERLAELDGVEIVHEPGDEPV